MGIRLPISWSVLTVFLMPLAGLVGACGRDRSPLAPRAVSRPLVPVGGSWHSVGPTSISNGQAWTNGIDPTGRIFVTGRINAVAANPQNPKTDIWVGSATGGAWHGRIDPDVEWKPMSDDWESLAVGVIRLDSCGARCNTVWVGTGENSIRRDTYYGAGVYLGRYDIGTDSYQWTQLGAAEFRHGSITGMALDSSTPDGNQKTVYVSLSSGVTANAAQATVTSTPAGTYGIWKTVDSGAHWTLDLDVGEKATDVVVDPLVPTTVYAGFPHKGVYRKVNGGPWTAANVGINPNELQQWEWTRLAVFRAAINQPAVVYAVMGKCPHPHTRPVETMGCGTDGVLFCKPRVYVSEDGGDTWTPQMEVLPQEFLSATDYATERTSYVTYTHALTIDPTDLTGSTAYWGGIALYRCTNKGWGFTPLALDKIHLDIHDIELHPGFGPQGGMLAYVVSDGGFFVGDGLNEWSSEYQDGLAVTQFQSVSASPAGAALLGGTQDNGTNLYYGSPIWAHLDDGDSGAAFFDATKPVRKFDVYLAHHPRRCDKRNCGFLWPCIINGLGVSDPVSWYPPMLQDPNPWPGIPDLHRLYFTTHRLFDSTDSGDSWQTNLSAGLNVSTNGPIISEVNDKNAVTAAAIAPSDSNFIYLGYYDGQIWRTTNAHQLAMADWEAVQKVPVPAKVITAIAVSPDDPDDVYVAVAGFAGGNVFHSTNAGIVWEHFSDTVTGPSLATVPVNSLLVQGGVVWAGTDQGMYATSDGPGHGAWDRDTTFPHVSINAIIPGKAQGELFAATHGRGVWRRAPWARIRVPTACCGWISLDTGPEDPPIPIPGPGDPPVFAMSIQGQGFPAGASCRASLLQPGVGGLETCATGSLDADGATIHTDDTGTLVTDRADYHRKPMAWACHDNRCIGGVPASRCQPTRVEVDCGGTRGTYDVVRAVATLDPPSTVLRLKPRFEVGAPATFTFAFRPSLKAADGTSRALCEVAVTVALGDASATVLHRIEGLVRADPTCRAAGVEAHVTGETGSNGGEDPAGHSPALELSAPTSSGAQLHAGLVAGGSAIFELDDIGPEPDLPLPSRLTFTTPERGASGGTLTISEGSLLGSCTIKLSIAVGAEARVIAAAVEHALRAPASNRAPGITYSPSCFDRAAPRDVGRDATSLSFLLARRLSIHSTDASLGWTLE